MTDAYIYDAIRTPRGKGKKGGALSEVKPIDLLVTLFSSLKKRNSLETSQVDDIILGCVTAIEGQGANIARIAALYSGWDISVPGITLNRWCASGLEAINLAAMKIMSGYGEMVVAGGIESMSRIPLGSDGGAWFNDPVVSEAISFIPQGVSADLIATIEGFTREELDRFASGSHAKASSAAENKRFKSIIPIMDKEGKLILENDEIIRKDTTVESLSALNPSFKKMGEMKFDKIAISQYPEARGINHMHHAGNSSALSDGAALTLIGARKKGSELGLIPKAKIKGMSIVGTEPTIMLTGPAPATKKVLSKTGLNINDIDLFEINEAFASVVLKTRKNLGIDPNKINVNGGAIAMGHPVGATGAMLIGTLIDELTLRDKELGLCVLCVGGGMGIATVIERV